MDAETLKTRIKVCMFDQCGTVVGMQKGLTQVVTPYLENKGWAGKPDSFVTWWRRTHFENSMIDALLHKEHTPYREIGQRAARHLFLLYMPVLPLSDTPDFFASFPGLT